MDRLAQSERELNEALQQNLTLQEQVHRLEGQLLAFRLKEKLDEIDSLASVDRTKLLQVAPSVSAA
jgi:hypothetical protein